MSSHPNADVRMRGFAQRVSVQEALAWLDGQLERLGRLESEPVPLSAAAGRVLADDVASRVSVPSFPRAMMDGYAVRSEDLAGATTEQPISLRVLGECFPGHAFPAAVGAGQAVRIMTGAPLPEGVDAVLPVELSAGEGNSVQALREIAAGKNLGSVGEDIQSGEVVLRAGRVLRPQDIGVLSSIGHLQIDVVRRPRVRIVVTGDELLPAGSVPAGCQIVDANGPMLAALVARDGGAPQHPGIVPDDRDAILETLSDEADVVLASGGSSVGQEDLVPTLLAEHGELAIHGIHMRPASPTGMGQLKGRLVFLLPGNPVACLCGYDFFAGRAIRSLGGRPLEWPYRAVRAWVTCEVKSPVGRLDYVRVTVADDTVTPLGRSGASVLSSTTRSDGFVIVPADTSGFAAGQEVEVVLYDS